MTLKIFWQDPYLTKLETTVKNVLEDQVTLAETIFYPFSGGQESDSGKIGNYPVLKAQKEGKEIYYTLEKGHSLKTGDSVRVTIDWERRYQLMRLHFAAEIVLELANQKFPGLIKIGAHISQDKARIDFQYDHSLTSFIPTLAQEAQAIIDSHHTILSAFSDEILERRYWKIEGFAQVPCGGPHIRNIQEIGEIHLKRANPGKGKERIEIYIPKNL